MILLFAGQIYLIKTYILTGDIMDNYVLGLISDFGYFGMFLGMVLEAVIIIIPSELILATGGILASQGIFSFWGAFFIGLFGSVFCAVIIYLISLLASRNLPIIGDFLEEIIDLIKYRY